MNSLLKKNRLEDIVDKMCSGVDMETVEAVLEIAVRCTDGNTKERPAMNQVLQLLEQEILSPSPSQTDYYESQSDYC